MSRFRDYLLRRREERAARPRVIKVIPGHRPRIEVRVVETPGERELTWVIWCLRCGQAVASTEGNSNPVEGLIEDHDDRHTGVKAWSDP